MQTDTRPRRFEKWRTPKRRNSVLLLLVSGLVILIASFVFDNTGVSEVRDEPTKGELHESSK